MLKKHVGNINSRLKSQPTVDIEQLMLIIFVSNKKRYDSIRHSFCKLCNDSGIIIFYATLY